MSKTVLGESPGLDLCAILMGDPLTLSPFVCRRAEPSTLMLSILLLVARFRVLWRDFFVRLYGNLSYLIIMYI